MQHTVARKVRPIIFALLVAVGGASPAPRGLHVIDDHRVSGGHDQHQPDGRTGVARPTAA